MNIKWIAAIAPACAVAALTQPAAGQETPDMSPMVVGQDTGTQDTAPDDKEAVLGRVTVTGSRISRKDYVSNSPVTTMDSSKLDFSAAPTVEESLNQLPQFSASAGAASTGVGRTRAGQASANLRGLGPQRTLVLMNGRRAQPTGADGSVDLNIIPQALLKGVEVITGGASAVYGSDAVAGVVNFTTRDDFDGLEVEGQLGSTTEWDGETTDLNVTLGKNLQAGRGNIAVSALYSERSRVDRPARDFFEFSSLASALPDGTIRVSPTNIPSQSAIDGIFAGYGYVPGTVARTNTIGFNNDGTLFSQNNPAVNYRNPTDHLYINDSSIRYSTGDFYNIQIPLNRYGVFGTAHYDFTDDMTGYAELVYNSYDATVTRAAPVTGGTGTIPIAIPVTSPFISADLAALLASRPSPNAPFSLTKRLAATGGASEENEYSTYQITTGLRGNFPLGDLRWDAYISQGQSNQDQTVAGFTSQTALTNLLQADDGGASLCNGGYNPFGSTAVSADCADYLLRTYKDKYETKQTVAEASVQGTLVELPAGQLRFSAGVDYRRNQYNFDASPLESGGDLINLPISNSTGGSTSAKEVFGELLVPLLENLPGIDTLELDMGYRLSSYDSIGDVSTYKIDANWEVTDSLRFRGGYSRAIRAPNVGELFGAAGTVGQNLGALGSIGSGDACDVRGGYRNSSNPDADQVRALCLAQGVPAPIVDTYNDLNTLATTQYSGNTDLSEETADTYSFGVVAHSPFKSPLLSSINMSVDYYSIELKDAVGQISGPLAVSKCFNADGSNPTYNPENLYCKLISRSSDVGTIDLIRTPLLNLGGYNTAGVDFQADWTIDLDSVDGPIRSGAIRLDTVVNYLDKFEIQNFPGADFVDYSNTIMNTQVDPLATAFPRLKSTTSLGWSNVKGGFTFRWRYLSSMDDAANVGTARNSRGVDSVSYYDFLGRFALSSTTELRLGVTNFTNVQPPLVGASQPGLTDNNAYEQLGRRVFVAVSKSF